jgi:phage host-nuclease inhibitor protein Gam
VLDVLAEPLQQEVASVATQKLKRIIPPDQPIESMEELNKDIQKATDLIRQKSSNEAARAKEKSDTDEKYDKRIAEISTTLEPLLDKIFTFTVDHWDELAPSNSPSTIPLNDVDFKRFIDTKGTKEVDEEAVISYIKNIEKTEMIATLRKFLGDTVVDELIRQLKALITTKEVIVLDSDTLKEVVKKQPHLTIPGFSVSFNNKVTMILQRSATEIHEKKTYAKEAREWTAS